MPVATRPRVSIRRWMAPLAVAALVLSPAAMRAPAPALAQEATPAACAPDTEASRQVALDWFAAASAGELDRFDELMTPDTVYGGSTVADQGGVEAVKDRYREVVGAFSDLAYEPKQVVASGDLVAVRFHAGGVFSGEFRGAPATGKPVEWNGIQIFRMDCGRIAESWQEIDQIHRASQLGILADLPVTRELLNEGVPQDPSADATPYADLDCPVTSPEEAEAVMRVWENEVWGGGDSALLEGLLIPGFDSPGSDQADTSGRDALIAAVDTLHAAIPDLESPLNVVFSEGDLVAARWTATGTMTGEYYGVQPTGQRVSYSGNTILRLECGKVAEAWTESDATGLLDQLGVPWKTDAGA